MHITSEKKSGFTLIELIIVMTIIGILAAIAVPRLSSYTTLARVTKTEENCHVIYLAAQEYIATHDVEFETHSPDGKVYHTFTEEELGPFLDDTIQIVNIYGQVVDESTYIVYYHEAGSRAYNPATDETVPIDTRTIEIKYIDPSTGKQAQILYEQ